MSVFEKISLITCMICVGTILLYQNYGKQIKAVAGEILSTDEKFQNEIKDASDIVVVIDPGHGGFDPGKVGMDNELEKDVNLNISRCLRDILSENEVTVVMTRDEDEALCGDEVSGKKGADLKKRVEIINNSGTTLAVSIHQNSFTGSSVKGGQVFYYENSPEGKMLAHCIQESIRGLDKDNDRVEKDNKSYYILRKSNVPAVIAECGFLSNEEEAKKLCDNEYQMQLAKKISEGIISYLNSEVLDYEYNS